MVCPGSHEKSILLGSSGRDGRFGSRHGTPRHGPRRRLEPASPPLLAACRFVPTRRGREAGRPPAVRGAAPPGPHPPAGAADGPQPQAAAGAPPAVADVAGGQRRRPVGAVVARRQLHGGGETGFLLPQEATGAGDGTGAAPLPPRPAGSSQDGARSPPQPGGTGNGGGLVFERDLRSLRFSLQKYFSCWRSRVFFPLKPSLGVRVSGLSALWVGTTGVCGKNKTLFTQLNKKQEPKGKQVLLALLAT